MRWQAALVVLSVLAGCTEAGAPVDPGYERVGDAIPLSLSDAPGDAARGAELFSAREGGHCVLCHQINGLDTPFQGNVGPDLSDIGNRLSAGQLRLRIVDYQEVLPGALMPSYYRKQGFNQVQDTYRDKTILTAQEIEDLVSYLEQQRQGDDAS